MAYFVMSLLLFNSSRQWPVAIGPVQEMMTGLNNIVPLTRPRMIGMMDGADDGAAVKQLLGHKLWTALFQTNINELRYYPSWD